MITYLLIFNQLSIVFTYSIPISGLLNTTINIKTTNSSINYTFGYKANQFNVLKGFLNI